MPPKKVTPTRPAPKKTTPTKPGVSKPPVGRGNQSGRTTGSKQVAAAAGPGKKAVPVKAKTPTSGGKGNVGVKSPTESTPKKHVWTEKDTMARKIQNAFRVYSCRKKLLMLKKKKEEFDALMETLEREVHNNLLFNDDTFYQNLYVCTLLIFNQVICMYIWLHLSYSVLLGLPSASENGARKG